MDYVQVVLDLAVASAPILGGVALSYLKAHNVNTVYYEAVARGGAVVLQTLHDSKTPVTLASAAAAAEQVGVNYLTKTAADAVSAKVGVDTGQLATVLAAEAVRQALAPKAL